ncbi:MAG: carbohydrate kinase family protein [Anaerolineales bacterium]
MSILILGDLIADINMRVPQLGVVAKDIHRLSYMEVGPGGACNVAIMASRFGLPVGCLGEVGDDGFGLVVSEGLKREGVDIAQLRVTEGARTPVAVVMVDPAGEPAYLGYPGSLQVRSWPADWDALAKNAQALFADGWAEYQETPSMVLHGLELAKGAGALTVFDPGPGNPEVDSAWIKGAVALSRVLLLNREEANRLVGEQDDPGLVKELQALGTEWVVLKLGAEGLVLAYGDQYISVPGFSVEVKDATGAGDCVAGAILYGISNGLDLEKLARLANATGAAKVMKMGTGHNVPTLSEIANVLQFNGFDAAEYLMEK